MLSICIRGNVWLVFVVCLFIGANALPTLTTNSMNQGSGSNDNLVIPQPIQGQETMAQPPPPPDRQSNIQGTKLISFQEPSQQHKELLIAVVTSPSHSAARDAIRQTFAKDAQNSGRATVKFFIGQISDSDPQKAEFEKQLSTETTDVVRFTDFTESYHNLSAKALDIFKYAADNNYKYVFKADDDTYIRVPLALRFLDQYGDPYLYAGLFMKGKDVVIDDPKSKWYMKDEYPYEPEDYANGPGVILGKSSLDFFRAQHANLYRYRVDDLAVGIWLRDLPLEKKNMPVDHYSYTTHEDSVWINPVNAKEMFTLHASEPLNPQICKETCLCHDGPQPNIPDCLTWSKFSVAGYRDLVPRATFLQLDQKK